MFISHKSNVVQVVTETEWDCRRITKGLSKTEYWEWIETIKDSDGVPDYSGETGYTIVECRDENVQERLVELNDYISLDRVYNIKWSDSKDTFVMHTNIDGKSVKLVESVEKDDEGQVTKTNYKMSHFVGDDSAKDARILAEEWTKIRTERDKLLTNSDWTQGADSPLVSGKKTEWATYRTKLRTLPEDQKDKTTCASITWPSQPS